MKQLNYQTERLALDENYYIGKPYDNDIDKIESNREARRIALLDLLSTVEDMLEMNDLDPKNLTFRVIYHNSQGTDAESSKDRFYTAECEYEVFLKQN